jgi:hypothetical protein
MPNSSSQSVDMDTIDPVSLSAASGLVMCSACSIGSATTQDKKFKHQQIRNTYRQGGDIQVAHRHPGALVEFDWMGLHKMAGPVLL